MKNPVLAAAVAAAFSLVSVGAHAASPNDLAQIREQLEGLMQRVDKLEQENERLAAENETLKAADEKLQAENEYLKTEARGLRKETAQHAVDVGKVKGADWAGKVKVSGDVRYRYEMISDDTLSSGGVPAADRHRDRVRARLSATAKATDNIELGIGMTTAEDSDPRSGNQSLSGTFSKKAFDLDTAYFDWQFAPWGNLIGGKMKQPFFKPGQSLFWDNDITPEGLALGYSGGMFFGTAYRYWISEASRTSDTMLHGLQFGARVPIGANSLTLAAHYYDLSSGQGRAPFYDDDANGNTTVTVGTTSVLLYDYEVVNLSAEYTMMLDQLPLQLWADVAQNQDPDDQDTAWGLGAIFGKASNPRSWELGASYHVIEKDALFAQLIDSDFGAGVSDSEGWVLRGAYAPVRNWVLNATYFLNARNRDVANSSGQRDIDYDRLQIDFSVKF